MPAAPEEPRFPYLQIDTTPNMVEELTSLLFEVGASGVELRDDTTTPRGPGGGEVRLISSFDDDDSARQAAGTIQSEYSEVPCILGQIVGDAWRDAYKQFFAPFELTRSVVVVPPWVEDHPVSPNQKTLWMDPGRAFGTGLHATTRLVSNALEKRKGDLPGQRVLDVGTGSGILALVALLLGAEFAVAVDNDVDVLDVARENAAKNGLAERVAISDASVESLNESFPVVVANIRTTTLVQMTASLRERTLPNGLLVLSGILASERGEIEEAFERDGFRVVEVAHEGEGDDAWVAITARRTA